MRRYEILYVIVHDRKEQAQGIVLRYYIPVVLNCKGTDGQKIPLQGRILPQISIFKQL